MASIITAAPCARCPFRKDVPIYLRRDRRVEIADSLVRGEWFPCHATVDYSEYSWDDDEYGGDASGASMCAGAAKALLANGATNNLMRGAERLGLVDLDRVEGRGPEVWDLARWQGLAEGATADNPEEEPEVVTCTVVNDGCLAPAGYGGLNGGVVVGTEPADGVCVECGEGLCTECGGDEMLCTMCRPWDEDDDD